MIKPENGFFKQGCAFRINNQEITQYPITLILHDSDYVSWTAAGEKLFLNHKKRYHFDTSNTYIFSTIITCNLSLFLYFISYLI